MIVKEFHRTREDGVNLYRTASDAGFKIRKVGTEEIYSEAIDIESASYIYEETSELIEIVEEPEVSEEPLEEPLEEE
jgi:hypothetical protein